MSWNAEREKKSTEGSGAPTGVFDSGVGGLTVMREIMRQLPSERAVYFGDTARVPYGSKSRETVLRYSRQIIRFLRTRGVKAIVVACNTASAYALETIRGEIDLPVIGVVKPGAKVAAQATRTGRIGVIGTEGTIHSQIYPEYIARWNPQAVVLGKACPLFVPLVEEGLLEDPVTDEIASRYLKAFDGSGIDTLILGCTHYPLLRSTVRRIMGETVTLVNPAYETARSLKELLRERGLENPDAQASGRPEAAEQAQGGHPGQYEFYVSDSVEHFQRFANTILPFAVEKAAQIPIEEY